MMTTALAENGAHKVYIVGRREDKLKEVAARYPEYVQSPVTVAARSVDVYE